MTPPGHAPARPHHNLTLGVLLLATLSYALQQTLVSPALPAIQRDLDTSTTAVTYTLTAFLLSASVATPIAGRLGDMFGKKRMLVIALGVFAFGSLLCAFAPSIELLIAGRVVQGGGAAVFPLSFAIVRDEFPRERVPGAVGTLSATFGIGGGAGVVLSGVIVDHLSYEWVFRFGFLVVVAALFMAWRYVPESPVTSPAKIDWGGAVLMSGGLIALLVGVSEGNHWGWTDARIVGLFTASVVLLLAWGTFEYKHPQPLVDMAMMRERTVLTTNLAGVLVGFGMFSLFILVPQFVQAPSSTGYGFGASVTEAGLFLLPATAVTLVAGPVAGWLGGRIGPQIPLAGGLLVALVAYVFLALEHSSATSILIATGLFGLGLGFAFASMINVIIGAVEPTKTGVATGMNTIMRTIGGSLGGQVAAAILTGHLVNGYATEHGFAVAFWVCAAAVAGAFGVALMIPRQKRSAEPEVTTGVPLVETETPTVPRVVGAVPPRRLAS